MQQRRIGEMKVRPTKMNMHVGETTLSRKKGREKGMKVGQQHKDRDKRNIRKKNAPRKSKDVRHEE